MGTRATKTFGMQTPSDLYYKLLFDIDRMRSTGSNEPMKYAAFDCAVTSYHIVDWISHQVGDEQFERLWGCPRDAPRKKRNFGKVNADRLPTLEFCRQIANSVKHFVITLGEDRADISTGSSVKLSPAFWANKPDTWPETKVSPFVYIRVGAEKLPVIELFEDAANDWKTFLIEERLFEPRRNEDE